MSTDWFERLHSLITEEMPEFDIGAEKDGSIKIEVAKQKARELTEKLAELYAIKRGGGWTPDLNTKIQKLEEILGLLEKVSGVLPIRIKTDLRCRIENAAKEERVEFGIFRDSLKEAEEEAGAVRLVGKVVKDESRPKGFRVEFLPEANVPRGLPQWIREAQIWVYDPQTKETLVYFPRNFQKEDEVIVNDDVAIAKALRDLYQRAKEGHRESKAEKAALKEAERPYFDRSTLKSLDEALIEGKGGVIAFGFNYQERFSDMPAVRGVPVVKFKAGKLTVIDLTPSFEEILANVKGVEYPFTPGERPDLRKVPQPLKFMLYRVLDSIRAKAGETGTGRGKTGPEEKAPPATIEVKTPKRRRRHVQTVSAKDRKAGTDTKTGKSVTKGRKSRAAENVALIQAAQSGEEPES